MTPESETVSAEPSLVQWALGDPRVTMVVASIGAVMSVLMAASSPHWGFKAMAAFGFAAAAYLSWYALQVKRGEISD